MSLSLLPASVDSIRTPEDVDQLLVQSQQGPVLLFKHSTSCGISRAALHELKAYLEGPECPPNLPVAVVRVIEERPLSLALAERVQVRHRSPQAILVHQGKALWQASHYSITADALHRAVQAHLNP